MLKTNKSKQLWTTLLQLPFPKAQSFLADQAALSGRLGSGYEEAGVLPGRGAFVEIAVLLWLTQGPIWALVMRTETEGTDLDFLFLFMIVEEIVEMLKYLQYTQYTQFYARISPTCGFNYSRYKVYAILYHHKRRFKKNRLAIFIQMQKLYHSNML